MAYSLLELFHLAWGKHISALYERKLMPFLVVDLHLMDEWKYISIYPSFLCPNSTYMNVESEREVCSKWMGSRPGFCWMWLIGINKQN